MNVYAAKTPETASDAKLWRISKRRSKAHESWREWYVNPERCCRALLWGAIVCYCGVFLIHTFSYYDRFQLNGFDLSIFDQAAWLISRGRTPFVTTRGLHILADHFSLILYGIAPLYWLAPTPKTLLAVQTIALALGAWPIFGLVYRRTKNPTLALVPALIYLVNPTLQWSNHSEFHPDTLATPLLLGAFYYLDAKAWTPYFACLLGVALTKETMGLVILSLGLYIFCRNRRIGLLTVLWGAASFAIALTTMRYFNHGKPTPYFWLYHQYGGSPDAILRFALCRPFVFLASMNWEAVGIYLFELLLPLGFLPLLAPELLIITAPVLLSNILNNRFFGHFIIIWYNAAVTPCLFAAAAIGLVRCRNLHSPWGRNIGLLCLGVGALCGLQWSPLCPLPRWTTVGMTDSQADELTRVLHRIPPAATISAPSAFLVHFSERAYAFTFPNPFYRSVVGATVLALQQENGEGYRPWNPSIDQQRIDAAPVEYVVYYRPKGIFRPQLYDQIVLGLLQSRAYGLIYVGQEVLVFHSGVDPRAGLRQLSRYTGLSTDRAEGIAQALLVWNVRRPSAHYLPGPLSGF